MPAALEQSLHRHEAEMRMGRVTPREWQGADRELMTAEFDYIVVGAGSAGCAVAARLAEDTALRVLLIEAGPRDRNPWIHIPAGYYRTIRSGRLVREFETEPEPELHDRVIRWPRGRVLGGSGAVNGLVYVRGQPADFDEWEGLGNPGWGWREVLPHFKRSERWERGEGEFHGGSGPIRVSDIRDRREICDAFIEAGKSLGLTERTDFNRGHEDGVGYYQLTTGNGLRSTPAAYLRQRGRGGPTIRTGETVRKILIDGDRAIGILARTGARTDTEYWAEREVVLCCGTVASPHLLQCSGIGPAAVLREAGVDVVHPLAGVGSNLVDRLQIRTVFRCSEPITINDVYNSPVRRALAGAQFALFRTGPLTIGAGQAAAFLRTDASLRRPDLELTFMAFSTPGPGRMPHAFPGFTILGYPLHPRSRGTIRIVSPDPSVPPRISPRYLTDGHDREMMIRALQMCRQFAEQPPLRRLIAEEHLPGGTVRTRDELYAYIRDNATTVFHCIGTCRMGPDPGAGDVVDARLRVHGLRGLRVADASIMPAPISANTNAATIMIGEKAAALIREDRNGCSTRAGASRPPFVSSCGRG